jgi:hypothetical protein
MLERLAELLCFIVGEVVVSAIAPGVNGAVVELAVYESLLCFVA